MSRVAGEPVSARPTWGRAGRVSIGAGTAAAVGWKLCRDTHRALAVARGRCRLLIVGDRTEADITKLVQGARDGDRNARSTLYEAVYADLRAIAGRASRRNPGSTTLGATALVNEVFLEFERRFPSPPSSMPESRRTFFRSVALAMRSILSDHARADRALKRGGGRSRVGIDAVLAGHADASVDDPRLVLDLEEAVTQLEAYNARWAEVVMHRFYAGRSIADTARMMGRAESSVIRDWALARAWLSRSLEGDADG